MSHRPNNPRKSLRSAYVSRSAGGLGSCVIAGFVTLLSLGCEDGESNASTDTHTGDQTGDSTSTGATTIDKSTKTGASFDTAYDSAPLFTAQPPALSATVADESTGPDVSNAPLQTCVPTTGPGQNLLIDDFEDEDLDLPEQEGRLGQWYSYEEVSGDHQLANGALDAPRLESHWAAHTSGTDHGSWAGFGVQLSDCVYDSTPYVGLHFWIRGTSNPINVALLTPGVVPVSNGGTCTKEDEGGCWDAYRQEVEVSEQWREFFLPFSEFEQGGYGQDAGPLDLTRIRTIEFQSDAGVFEYWVDDLSFYIEEVYTELPDDTGSTASDSTATDSTATDSTTDVTSTLGDAGSVSSEETNTTNLVTSETEDTTLVEDGGGE